ncbi:MAG: PAS domain S-box protein [Desulfosarcina sp.]|nr:PAS domain S-box protein [Desulfosarcina sp.]MBC2742536.1 PAS domain S-box protein [Desulfosarcina sp.]MBC2765446.1 PAS domain S-box protein [Desulfosarcina sp.]
MKLRSILRILSLLAFLSAGVAGYLYYSLLKDYAFQEAERSALNRLQATKKNLSAFFSENTKPVRVMAGMTPLVDALVHMDPQTLNAANALLDLFKKTLDVEVCYLMDIRGNTIASSNRNDADSFVGMNFSFRPYFQDAMQGLPGTYLALGTTSRKRGAYYSYPVYRESADTPIGIAVIKASIFFVEKELTPEETSIQLVVDPLGVIFISSRPEWLYQLLWQLNPKDIRELRRSRQFGNGPWHWTGLRQKGEKLVVDPSGKSYLFHQVDIDKYPGWRIVHLYDIEAASKLVSEPLSSIIRPVIIILCTLLGASIFFLYRRASMEITRRRTVERALRKSEERYRSLYHQTPAMLHSIDETGNLVSVSNYWSEALGYTREEVIGRKLTDFLSPVSRKYAEEKIIPTFFKEGFIKDVPYQFIKKNGAVIEVLLSAITDHDEQRRTIRSLAVSIDVTERNIAERALKEAKEALSSYSKDLESQVRKRTREISGILQYTPAVIYIKDADGKYAMVNSRFEQLFGVQSPDVRGKTDQAFLAPDIAEQFFKNDERVLREKQSLQVEESIVIDDAVHTYLSTKFPLYDGKGKVTGVCGIATDITVLKKAQEQLRRLSASIMTGQEKERAYLARELHDELGQVLTALRMEAVWIRNRVNQSDPTASARALTMCELIDKTIEEVRGLAIRLRPGVLDHLGLVEAVEWYTADFEKRYDITCIFEHDDGPEIRGNLATAAYRITQEALTNVARHASATRTKVTMSFGDGNLKITIRDNGKGFEIESLGEAEGLGMANMRERASLVGGVFDVQSRPRGGTRIRFTVPLTKS